VSGGRRDFPPASPEFGPDSGLDWWRPVRGGEAGYACGWHYHSSTRGSLDESARRLSHEELSAADLLAREGHDVRSLAAPRGYGRQADLSVCGSPVEVKSFAPLSERRREPGARSVFNKLVDASGQAPHVVLVAAGSGLSAANVQQGLADYEARAGRDGTLRSVRAIGEGFDLTWSRVPLIGLGFRAGRSVATGRSAPDPGWGL